MTKTSKLFVSKVNGPQDFVTYSVGAGLAIIGNVNSTKIDTHTEEARVVTLKEVKRTVQTLRRIGVKVLDSRADTYNDLKQAFQAIEAN